MASLCITELKSLSKIGSTWRDSVCDRRFGFFSAHRAFAHRCLDLLPRLFEAVHIPTEVYNEVVIAGTGRPGADSVARASWIEVTPVQAMADLKNALEETGLGSVEVAAVQLARELGVEVILLDERRARSHAEGTVVGHNATPSFVAKYLSARLHRYGPRLRGLSKQLGINHPKNGS
jgi:hypothetical protein